MLKLGDYSYGEPKIFGGKSDIIVGKFCSISNSAIFDCGFQHKMGITTYPLHLLFPNVDSKPTSKGDIKIGNDVWICDEAMIMSGVTIGDGAIIGYRAVVTKDVPPYAVVGGVPAQILKYRFGKETVKKLLEIKWWDWDINKIKENADMLMDSLLIRLK